MRHRPVGSTNLSGGHSEPHPNIMGPPGIPGLFILGSKQSIGVIALN